LLVSVTTLRNFMIAAFSSVMPVEKNAGAMEAPVYLSLCF